MTFRKYVALAAIGTALVSAPVQAGNIAEPVIEAEVIAEETSNSGGFILPLILLALLAIAISSSGSDSVATF